MASRKFFEISRRESAANSRICAHGRRKADSIQSVVDRTPARLLKLDRILHQRMAEQRERQEAVRDRRAVRRFSFGAFAVQVNPLPVVGGFRKRGDAFLRYGEPIAHCDFAANGIFQRFDPGGDFNGRPPESP